MKHYLIILRPLSLIKLSPNMPLQALKSPKVLDMGGADKGWSMIGQGQMKKYQ